MWRSKRPLGIIKTTLRVRKPLRGFPLLHPQKPIVHQKYKIPQLFVLGCFPYLIIGLGMPRNKRWVAVVHMPLPVEAKCLHKALQQHRIARFLIKSGPKQQCFTRVKISIVVFSYNARRLVECRKRTVVMPKRIYGFKNRLFIARKRLALWMLHHRKGRQGDGTKLNLAVEFDKAKTIVSFFVIFRQIISDVLRRPREQFLVVVGPGHPTQTCRGHPLSNHIIAGGFDPATGPIFVSHPSFFRKIVFKPLNVGIG